MNNKEVKLKDTSYIKNYVCDCGSLLITDTNNAFGVLIPNGYGDCRAKVYEYNIKNCYHTPNYDAWSFVTTVYGNFNIHTYDCLDENGNMYNFDNTITVKAKRTAFYKAKDESGDILFQIWEA